MASVTREFGDDAVDVVLVIVDVVEVTDVMLVIKGVDVELHGVLV